MTLAKELAWIPVLDLSLYWICKRGVNIISSLTGSSLILRVIYLAYLTTVEISPSEYLSVPSTPDFVSNKKNLLTSLH